MKDKTLSTVIPVDLFGSLYSMESFPRFSMTYGINGSLMELDYLENGW